MRKFGENTRVISSETNLPILLAKMTQQFAGSRYNFLLTSENSTDATYFSIRAICRSTNRTSSINNLNSILGELGVDQEDERVENSDWHLSKNQARKFIRKAADFLSSESYVQYLERDLDDDRRCGEWANLWINGEIISSD